MKLIICVECSDVVKLDTDFRSCNCGKSGGMYLEDGLNARIHGEHAIPIGFNNHTLRHALVNRPERGMGSRFEAFVIPKQCDTIDHPGA